MTANIITADGYESGREAAGFARDRYETADERALWLAGYAAGFAAEIAD